MSSPVKIIIWIGFVSILMASRPGVADLAQQAQNPVCERCAGQVKIIACIEEPAIIERILAHLKGKEATAELVMLPEGRGPPQARLFD